MNKLIAIVSVALLSHGANALAAPQLPKRVHNAVETIVRIAPHPVELLQANSFGATQSAIVRPVLPGLPIRVEPRQFIRLK